MLNSVWILVFPIGIKEFSTAGKWFSEIYFSSLHDYWPPTTWNSLAHTCCQMEWCEKRAFSSSKWEKKSWYIKTKREKAFYWQLGLRVWMIILVIMGWAHKRQRFTLIPIKIMRIRKFLFTCNRLFKHIEIVSNLNVFVVMARGNVSTIYISPFYKNPNIHTYEIIFFSHNIRSDVQQSIFSSR